MSLESPRNESPLNVYSYSWLCVCHSSVHFSIFPTATELSLICIPFLYTLPLYSLSIPSMCILYNSPTTFTTPSTHTITITITITYIYNIIVVWAVQPQSSLSNIKTVIFYKCQGGYLYGQCPCEHTLKEKCFACQVLLLKKDYCNTSTLDDNGDSVDVFY